jgi:hypothetical protein
MKECRLLRPDLSRVPPVGWILIASEDGDGTLALTVDGKVLLRMLGAEPAERLPYPNALGELSPCPARFGPRLANVICQARSKTHLHNS